MHAFRPFLFVCGVGKRAFFGGVFNAFAVSSMKEGIISFTTVPERSETDGGRLTIGPVLR